MKKIYFQNLNIAVKILKNRIKTWKDGDQIGFKIGKKHFSIIKDN